MLSVSRPYSVNDRIINEYVTVGGIRIGRGNRSIRRKHVPVPLSHNKSHITLPVSEPKAPQWEVSE
jgi:hypothetical protein